MEDYLKCNKCSEDDHEGYKKAFCRCEGRNIRIAKEQRARKENWTSCRERLSPKDHIADVGKLVYDSPTPENK